MYRTTLIFNCETEIVQIEYSHNRLLFSSRKNCYLYDFTDQKSYKVFFCYLKFLILIVFIITRF